MRELLLAVIIIAITKFIFMIPEDIDVLEESRLAIGFGFLLVTAYITGLFFNRIRLPKISGYLIAGMLFGPHIFNFIDTALIENMKIIDQLALTFIALNAGGELRLRELAEQKKTILWLLISLITFIFIGMSLIVITARPVFPFLKGAALQETLVVAALLGTLAIARSPSSIIAIIQECRAKGPFSETVLGVTIVIDFVVILIFAVVVSISESVMSAGQGFDLLFLTGVAIQVAISILAGIAVGVFVAYYIKNIKVNISILLLVLAFLIYNISGAISSAITQTMDISFHLEPLLIAITAGFYIQNFTRGGPEFIDSLEKGALPVYVLFFAAAGLVLDIRIIREMIGVALLIVAARFFIAMLSGYTAGRISGSTALHSRLYGLGFITQAGVSIGLAQEIIRRFPEWGLPLGTLIIAAVNINQLIGPVVFKYALDKTGEIHRKPQKPARQRS
ncbi:cation:proton antiporter [candidate division KSB1 bacterium]